jgi:putative ABC transport system permease protein
MKYFVLVWAGLWRRRVRTILTLLSIVAAFLLYGTLHGVTSGIDDAIDTLSDTRIRIMSRVNITQALPIAHLPQIENVDGVEGVAFYNFFGGYFQEPTNGVNAGAVDMERMDVLFPELNLTEGAVDAMRRTRNGAVIGRDLAENRGWKIGDQIPLRSQIWRRKDGLEEWNMEIVGIYTFGNEDFPSNELWMNYDYFDEARAGGNGTVTMYFATVDDASQAARVAEAIDRQFANSTFETQSQNEKDFVRAQVAQIGDINFFINAIIGAVLFTLLFLTANTMMQSVRERIPELAVLKTYGYSNAKVMWLVFAESAILCLAAAAVGLTIAATVFPSIFLAMGVAGLPLPVSVMVIGILIALALAAVSALPPAIRAQRLDIVDALAGR